MESAEIETSPEKTVASDAFDTPPAGEKPHSPVSADAGARSATSFNMAGNPSADGVAEIADAIQALERKVLELKTQVKADQTKPSRPKIRSDLEKSRRMESVMYKHRKEWESKFGPGAWYLVDSGGRFGLEGEKKNRPRWKVPCEIKQIHEYPRPNISDFAEDFPASDADAETDDDDDFDRTIDYGDRRDRLRKHFEWEMDRIYMEEEMDRRKRERREQEVLSNQKASEEVNAPGIENQPEFAEPKLQRLDWSSFKPLVFAEESHVCVLDILVGDPMIEDDGSRRWFGNSRRVHKLDLPQDRKTLASIAAGQLPLPERVQIHSKAILQIFGTILGKDMEGWAGSSFVLIRPFKLLVEYEPALRDWCLALGKKLEGATTAEKDNLSKTADDPKAGRPKYSDDSNDGGNGSVDQRDEAEQKDEGAEDQGNKDGGNEEEGNEEEDNSNDLSKSSTALAHLRCLLEFVDSDIAVKREYLNSPLCRKVSFLDLWLLFRPGVEVISQDGKQAYRVVGVTSVKHSVGVASRWEWFGSSQNKRKRQAPFTISCVYIDFDGENIAPVSKVFDFKRFDGEREVTSLEVYPLRCHPAKRSDFTDSAWEEVKDLPENQRYRRKLIQRGVKFLDIASVKHMYYTGSTLEVREEVESQVVVDFETAFAVEDPSQQLWKPNLTAVIGNPTPDNTGENADEPPPPNDSRCYVGCCFEEAVYDDSDIHQQQRVKYINSLLPNSNNSNDQPSIAIIPRPLSELQSGPGNPLVSDEELVIMSYRVFGFVLRSHKWAKLDLSFLTEANLPETSNVSDAGKDVEETKNKKRPVTAFDRLVLDNRHRRLIVSLVSQHFRDKESKTGRSEEFDIVKGKGKGLIILLHGAPGVGKTSTAEGIAELFKKPLFQITCSDLGTTASEVEKALETNFALASMWDCILLLDEADVFLAERTKLDFQRNGLVAVFLRVMEYYTGILFLTTNRVGDFDEAFTSRIHVSLYYPQLDKSKTVDVFKINMDMIEERCKERGRKIDIDRAKIGSFAFDHYEKHEKARWNGRQIRNACQTALALAEFEAQGNSHKAVHNPDVVVELRDTHFKTARDAYIEFTMYMNEIYGINASRRAKENSIRAIWIDESEVVSGSTATGKENLKRGYLRLVRGESSANSQQPPPRQVSQQLPQQPFPPQQQPQYPYQYQNFRPQPAYYSPGQVPVQAPQAG
ncbi:hypothetical protein CMUS01_05339 [Colletotrichum musicola]|uniref:AAA+ ATPase domain-containing protein n=1 Tax=Colletotrichum musicola TaxID=2175873 RepID=A0A8H6KSC1_9PEZI|nr:hypothetical protein CMUS01_05339 [Colletotrichum musicola]